MSQVLNGYTETTYFLNRIIPEDIISSIAPVGDGLGVQYTLRGSDDIVCRDNHHLEIQYGKLSEPPHGGCDRQLDLLISPKNEKRFEEVLKVNFGKFCKGAKRVGKF